MSEEKVVLEFGRYKGIDVEQVPDVYLLWIWENWNGKKGGKFWEYLEENIEAIKKNVEEGT